MLGKIFRRRRRPAVTGVRPPEHFNCRCSAEPIEVDWLPRRRFNFWNVVSQAPVFFLAVLLLASPSHYGTGVTASICWFLTLSFDLTGLISGEDTWKAVEP